ncbi:flavodoxin family protein [Paenibacillus sp. 1P07SE]|uniref:flavodoxin family protein n=1 Tax=Paenibacillus sp. 1P07SE TaxID=3132209 RepID=UPI0039A4E2F8
MSNAVSPKTVLILVGSPRRSGNSAAMAEAARKGVEAAGHQAKLRYIDDYIESFLRDCRSCRLPSGDCSITDRFQELFKNDFLPADGVIFSTPLYWYGVSAQIKAFFDRTFCYYAASYPDAAQVTARMSRKRLALTIASEETYPGAALGVIHQLQEYTRYTYSELVGVVRGIGNSRGEVAGDPGSPLDAAERLGYRFFDASYSDYHFDSPRDPRVWQQP